MLTIFSTPKPFRGHIATIQRNAIQSWRQLHPECEVILFGDEVGAAAAARELGARHEPEVAHNQYGTPYLNSMFDRAQQIARHDRVCFVNCDIVLTSDFRQALERVSAWRAHFLMVGRRWDLDITEPLIFSSRDWERELRARARQVGKQRPAQWIDYFAFRRGLYQSQLLPFAIGRPGYDNWLVWKTRSLKVPVVDASAVVMAIHQNHDYSHHPAGEKGVLQGEEAKTNSELLGEWCHFCTVEDATHVLVHRGIRFSLRHWVAMSRRATLRASSSAWFGFLNVTRPVRHWLGLRRRDIRGSA